MNISSIVVRFRPAHIDYVKEEIAKLDCTLHFNDEARLIITIEREDLGEESAFLKELEAIEHVVSADIMYSYNEEEIKKAVDKMDSIEKVTDELNKDTDANSIKYKGDINNYLK